MFSDKPRIALDCAGQTTEVGCTTLNCVDDIKYTGGCAPPGEDDCRVVHSTACYCNTTLCNKSALNAVMKSESYGWIYFAIALTALYI